MKKKKSTINIKEFEKTDREDISIADFEAAFSQILSHPAKPEKKSENREPTRKELNKKWKLGR